MYLLLLCVSPVARLRGEVARMAFDHGLHETLPSVFEGEVTRHRRGLLLRALRAVLRRSRPCRVELVTLPSGRSVRRLSMGG